MKTTNLRKTIATTLAGLALLGTPLLHAVDVSEYGALKGKRYTQDTAGTPSDEFVFYGLLGYVRMTADAAVTEATVQPPGSMAWPMEANATNPRLLQFDMAFATTPADLNMLFPNGDYVVAMTTVHDGNKSVALSLTGDSYPNTPTFLNFAALETVDSSAAFALSWSAFTGGGANDVIEVRVVNNDDIQVFGTTLTGTATSVNIPANTLSPESSYTVTLTFVKVTDRDTTSYAGATGLAGYYKATEASLTTTTGGGGTDTTPPHLVASYPANGATGVATGFPLAFSFDEAMAAAQSIAWSANVNAANINYSWSDDTTLTCTYTGGWPAGATISWTLNPTGQPQNFKDVAGNPLAANTYTGSFTTAGNTNTNGPCGGENDGRGYGGVTKELFYVQTSTSAPTPDTNKPAVFLGSMTSPTNNPVTSAKVQVPGGPLLTLSNFFGVAFMSMETYPSQAAMDTARPSGTYNMQLTRTTGSPPSASLSLTGSYPPTPHILNYTPAQAVNPGADFMVQWNGFTGATANDSVTFSIANPLTGWYWVAPDPCVPRLLPNTATSVTIPAGTLQAGTTYQASLIYSRMTDYKTNAIPDISLMAWLRKSVDFTMKTTGTSTSGARFIGWRVLSGNRMELKLQGPPGASFLIEGSNNLLSGWYTVTLQTIPPGGVATFEVNVVTQPAFFRAKTP